jgi:DNA-binding beta-propeller fold protein YncE
VTAGPDGRYYVSNYGGTIQVVPASGGASSVFNVGGNLPAAAYMAFLDGDLYAASWIGSAGIVQSYDGTTGAVIGSFTRTGQGSGIAVTPEPGSALLLLAGVPLILRRRRAFTTG